MSRKGGGDSKFRHEMPLSFAYARENGWVFDGTGKKHKALRKGTFKYSMSTSPGDMNADKQVLRHLINYDKTGNIYGCTEKT